MSQSISIYLAGKIPKDHERDSSPYWSDADQERLAKALAPLPVNFLNPMVRSDDLADQRSVFGRDMLQVYAADAVFVDAREKRGLGVGAEMMWGKMNQIPLIVWAPRGSHYHKESTSLLGQQVESWIHPFVLALGDVVVSSLDEGANWLLSSPSSIKGPDTIREAMEYYLSTQFPSDQPMLDLARTCDELNRRFRGVSVAEKQ